MGNRQNRRKARKENEAVEDNSNGLPLSFCQTCITNSGRKNKDSKAPSRKKLKESTLSVYSSIVTVETDSISKPVVLITSNKRLGNRRTAQRRSSSVKTSFVDADYT